MLIDKKIESGIEWVGEIPENWSVFPAGGVFSEVKEKNTNNEYCNAFSFRYGEIIDKKTNGIDDENTNETLSSYRVVIPNTIMINGLNLNYDFITQRVAIVKEKGIITSAYLAVQPDETRIVAKFALYLFKAYDAKQAFHGMGSGVRKTLKYSDFKNIKIVAPSMTEQQHIVDFLDQKVQEIEALISEIKASIEEYKVWKASIIYEAVTKGIDSNDEMKESGIEWIGKIPRKWNVCALKLLTTKIGSGKTPSGGAEVYTTEGVMFLRSQNVHNTGLEIDSVSFISNEIDESMASTRVEYQDVLLNITGGSIGRCCIYDLEGVRANVNQHVCILRADRTKLLPQYLRYFWNSASGPMVVAQYQTGGNRQGLNFEQIGSTKIPFCSIEEQKNIVDYLDVRCGEIDALVKEKEALISDLEAYKKSLIFEVVTGKRKV